MVGSRIYTLCVCHSLDNQIVFNSFRAIFCTKLLHSDQELHWMSQIAKYVFLWKMYKETFRFVGCFNLRLYWNSLGWGCQKAIICMIRPIKNCIVDRLHFRHCQTAKRYWLSVEEPFPMNQYSRVKREVKNPEVLLTDYNMSFPAHIQII